MATASGVDGCGLGRVMKQRIWLALADRATYWLSTIPFAPDIAPGPRTGKELGVDTILDI